MIELPRLSKKRWLGALVCCWVVFVSSAYLKEYAPYVHWYGTAVVALVLWLRLIVVPGRVGRYTFTTGFLLACSIAIAALQGVNPGYDLLQAAKVAVILLVLLPMLMAKQDTIHGLLAGAEGTVLANLLFVAAGLCGATGFVALMAVGRYGTFLNPPGSLWRIGVLVLVSSALRLLLGRASLWSSMMFLGSTALIVLDGSRTGYLAVFAAAALVLLLVAYEVMVKGSVKLGFSLFRKLTVLTAGVAVCMVMGPISLREAYDIGFLERGNQLIGAMQNEGVSGLEGADDSRSLGWRAAVSEIAAHPFLGTGMGTTLVGLPTGAIVVHCAYLQIWADVGVLGFVSYLALTVGVLFAAWRPIRAISTLGLGDRIVYYNGMYVLMCWAMASLFHPLSTEISEWIMFFVGLAGVQFRPAYALHQAARRPLTMGAWAPPDRCLQD